MHLGPPRIGNFKPPLEKRKRPKSPAEKREGRDEVYKHKVRSLPCCVCGKAPPSEVHHLKCAGGRGMGKRSDDKWGVPMCHEHHVNGVERVGSKNEVAWFRKRGIDCLSLAAAMYARRHSVEEMGKVLEAHHTIRQQQE